MIQIWAEDGHRVGRKPVQRIIWAPKGQRPVAAVRRRHRWEGVYDFVHPATGQASSTVLPTVNAAALITALMCFATDAGIDAPSASLWPGTPRPAW